MTLKDDDWINLLAGEEVDGVDDKDKKMVEAMRIHLLKDQDIEIDISDDSIAKEREQLLKMWDVNFADVEKVERSDSDQRGGSKVAKLSRFKRAFVPFAVAASVAMLAVTLVLRDPYPDIVEGYGGLRGSSETNTEQLVIETTDPKAVYKTLKKSLAENEVLYRFKEGLNGWDVTFFTSSDNIETLNQILTEYDLEVKKLGDIDLSILQK